MVTIPKLKNGQQHVHFVPGFDKRDPNPSKSYGISGGKLVFAERRGNKVISVGFFMDIYPTVELQNRPGYRSESLKPLCDGLYTHYKFKKDAGEWAYRHDECDYLGRHCYGEAGSSLYGQEITDRFVVEGSDAVWDEIDKEFKEQEKETK